MPQLIQDYQTQTSTILTYLYRLLYGQVLWRKNEILHFLIKLYKLPSYFRHKMVTKMLNCIRSVFIVWFHLAEGV
jgi:hypothetical protein